MQIESLANRFCALQCDMLMCVGGDEVYNLDVVTFTFMLWDCTAYNVRIGCIGSGENDDDLLFVVRYESTVAAGVRLFTGKPYMADCSDHTKNRALASQVEVVKFLKGMQTGGRMQTDIVFDGDLAVDKIIKFHLQFGLSIDGKTLLIKDVIACENVLLVIDSFQ